MTIRPFDEWVNSLTDEEKEEMILYRIGDNKHGIRLIDYISRSSFIQPY